MVFHHNRPDPKGPPVMNTMFPDAATDGVRIVRTLISDRGNRYGVGYTTWDRLVAYPDADAQNRHGGVYALNATTDGTVASERAFVAYVRENW